MNIEKDDMINASRRPWEIQEYAGFKKQRLNPTAVAKKIHPLIT